MKATEQLEKEIEKLIVQNYWGPYSSNELIKMVKGGQIVLDNFNINENITTQNVDNWMEWLDKRIGVNSTEREYIQFALRNIRK